MPRYIVKLTDKDKSWYLEWSTIVDAPVTHGMDLEEFRYYYLEEYGQQELSKLDNRLERVEKHGISGSCYTLDQLLAANRAGPQESCLSKQEIIDKYCWGKE